MQGFELFEVPDFHEDIAPVLSHGSRSIHWHCIARAWRVVDVPWICHSREEGGLGRENHNEISLVGAKERYVTSTTSAKNWLLQAWRWGL